MTVGTDSWEFGVSYQASGHKNHLLTSEWYYENAGRNPEAFSTVSPGIKSVVQVVNKKDPELDDINNEKRRNYFSKSSLTGMFKRIHPVD